MCVRLVPMQYNIVHTHSGLAILLRHMLSPSKGIDIILLGRWRGWRKARGNAADSLGKVVGGGGRRKANRHGGRSSVEVVVWRRRRGKLGRRHAGASLRLSHRFIACRVGKVGTENYFKYVSAFRTIDKISHLYVYVYSK